MRLFGLPAKIKREKVRIDSRHAKNTAKSSARKTLCVACVKCHRGYQNKLHFIYNDFSRNCQDIALLCVKPK